MEKKCYRCKQTKDITKFSKNKAKKDGHSAHCKECHSILRKAHYEKNKNKIKKQVKKYKEKYAEWFRELKDKPCADCEKKYPYYVMQFDHKDRFFKEDNVGTMFALRVSKKKILDEIKKCDLVCANCHAERTHKRLCGCDV